MISLHKEKISWPQFMTIMAVAAILPLGQLTVMCWYRCMQCCDTLCNFVFILSCIILVFSAVAIRMSI